MFILSVFVYVPILLFPDTFEGGDTHGAGFVLFSAAGCVVVLGLSALAGFLSVVRKSASR